MDTLAFGRGVGLFNTAAYFEAHEVLEDVWREAPESEKRFLQGLIQIAVGLHHHSKDNIDGACSLLARGAANLKGYPDEFGGIDVPSLREAALAWSEALRRGDPTPPLPRIRFRE
jgi:uncharacterized protein